MLSQSTTSRLEKASKKRNELENRHLESLVQHAQEYETKMKTAQDLKEFDIGYKQHVAESYNKTVQGKIYFNFFKLV